MTWTNAALVDRASLVCALGNTATGQPDIPNRTPPEVGFRQRNRHIHQDLTSFVREVAAPRQKLDPSIATRPADWGSTVDSPGPEPLDRLPDHQSSFGAWPTPPKCTHSIATILLVSFDGLNGFPGAIRCGPGSWGFTVTTWSVTPKPR